MAAFVVEGGKPDRPVEMAEGRSERRRVVDPPDPHHVALPAHGVEIQAVGTEPRPPQAPIKSAHAGAERLARADVIARTPRLEFPFSKRLLVVDLGKPRRLVAALPDFREPRVVIAFVGDVELAADAGEVGLLDPAAGGGFEEPVACLDRRAATSVVLWSSTDRPG